MGRLDSKGLVRRVLSPLIAVASSPELDALCVENNIPSFLELIRPFGVEIEGKVTIRDSKGQPKTHYGSTVRFADLKRVEPASLYSEDALLSRNISDLIKNQARTTDNLKAEVMDSIALATKAQGERFEEVPAPPKNTDKFHQLLSRDLDDLTPWFSLYRNTFFNQLRLAEHETFDHPVACIVATSTSNPQPLDTLARLYEQNTQLNQLPYVSPDIFQYYVLVHDVRRGNMESTITLFEKIKKTLGIHCQLLLINSRPSRTEGQASSIVPDVWGHVRDVSQPGKFELRESRVSDLALFAHDEDSLLNSRSPGECGSQLSPEDFEGLKALVKKMFVESLLPHMERCMHLWNEQVASSRRGFTGRLFSASKRYFSSSRTQVTPGISAASSSSSINLNSPVGSVYLHSTPEAQLRKLADYAFMLRDYDFARSTYETVKKDFQADGAWRFYAGAQEMTGLCLLFSEASGAKIDVERYYDKAVRYYHANKMVTWAARSVLLYHAMLKHHGRYGDIPQLLGRLTSEDSDLRSALLLEQAAHGFLRIARVRKFGFHLILAGHRYNKCNQREHAYYCYQLAASVFGVAPAADTPADDSWLVTRPPKRWGLMEDHISFSLGRQSFHLGELRQAIAHFTWLLHDSQQPAAVQAGYMKEFMYIYKNYIASTGHEILMEPATSLPVPVLRSVAIQVPKASTSWEGDADLSEDASPAWGRLAAGVEIPPSGILSQAEPKLQICPLQESFQVVLEIHNPLAIPLALSSMALDFAYEEGGSINTTAAADLLLEARESATLTFLVTPQSEGLLRLKGLTLMINEHARTYKSFARRGPRLNDTAKHRQTRQYGPNHHCTVRIVAALPKLALQLDGLPETIFSGEVVSGRLQLRNTGAAALTHLSVNLSHPTFLTFGCPTSRAPPQGTTTIDNNITDCSSIAVVFYPASEPCNNDTPPLERLDPGQVGQVPIHIRGDRVGVHKIYLLLRYHNAQDRDCRVAKLLFKLEVLPSLKINAFTRPSVKSLGKFIVGIEVENVQTLGCFRITQLSSLSHKWQISPVSPRLPPQKLLLIPGTSTSLYFTVAPTAPGTPKEIDWDSTEAHLATALQSLTRASKLPGDYPPLALTYANLPLVSSTQAHANPQADKTQGIWDFPCQGLYLASRNQNRTNWLAKDMAILSPVKAKAAFPLLHPSDIDLCLFWEVIGKDGKTRQGLHFIIGITFNLAQNPLLDHIPRSLASPQEDSKLTRSLFEGTAQEKIQIIRHLISYPRFSNESPVRAILQTPDAIHLSFSNGPVEVPVAFLFKNFSWNRSADFTLSLLPAGQAPSNHAQKRDVLSDGPPLAAEVCSKNVGFWWDGPSQHSQQSLEPGAHQLLRTRVVVAEPGTYDLNMWQLKVTSHTIPPEHEESQRAYRSYLAGALGQPNLQSPTITHLVSPPLPHFIHVYDLPTE